MFGSDIKVPGWFCIIGWTVYAFRIAHNFIICMTVLCFMRLRRIKRSNEYDGFVRILLRCKYYINI